MNSDVMVNPWSVGKWSLWILAVTLVLLGAIVGAGYIAHVGIVTALGAATLTVRGFHVKQSGDVKNAFELGRDAERLHAVR